MLEITETYIIISKNDQPFLYDDEIVFPIP
jgi:hypothetical protein